MTKSYKHKLIFHQGDPSPTEFEISHSEEVIGRDPMVDIPIQSPGVSRRHARLVLVEGGYSIEDLGSSNGTFVNGTRLTRLHPLNSGDQIMLGKSITCTYQAIVVESQETAVSPASSPPANLMQTELEQNINFDELFAVPPKLIVSISGNESQSYSLTKSFLTLGRGEGNDIVIPSPIVSGQHARIEQVDGGYQLTVVPQAKNPVLFEGRPLTGIHIFKHGDVLRIGSLDPGLMVSISYESPSEAVDHGAQDIVFGDKTLIQIGRDPSNDVVLTSPTASRFHAQVERVGQRYRVRDLRSSNGTFVNGERIEKETWLKPNDTIRVGHSRFVMGTDQLAQFDESGGLHVDAMRLNKWVRKDLNILQDISVVFKPREFIIVVGQSGGGKSTLLDAIAGYRPATQGEVLVNGTNIYHQFDAIRNDIGYVPQKDIIHMELTVYQALDYAAQLRMPADTTKEERHQRIIEVLEDLDILHRKDVQISGLSGGQQKRVSIGVELLTKPGLFFLDEPTSGLDPGTETALMQLMRRLADQGRTIVLVTHATKNVMLGDKVIFLARGGYLAWFGPPDEALDYFDKYRPERSRRAGDIEFDEIYAILDDSSMGSPDDWARRYREHAAYHKYILEPLEGKIAAGGVKTVRDEDQIVRRIDSPIHRKVSSLRQFLILSARNVKILTRDRFALALMLAVAPLVSLLDVVLSIPIFVGSDPLDFDSGQMSDVIFTLFLLTIYGVMVGSISQMREIVKEQEVYKRERLVNLKILPYVLSKVWVAALLALYQAVVYTVVHYLAFDMPNGRGEFIQVIITMALATLAGMMLGLFASALAPNANSAPLIVILFILPQIVLGGALIPLPESVSAPTSTHWAFKALMGIAGGGSDVAADICWDLPEDVRDAMTIDDKSYFECQCMGLQLFDRNSCDFPGIGMSYSQVVDEPEPVAPLPLENPPQEPVLPEPPVEPADQSDSVAMADFFKAIQEWQGQVNEIQATNKQELEAYKAKSEVYKTELMAYQQGLAKWQFAVKSAETTIGFYEDFSWSYVDKEDNVDYWGTLIKTWLAQATIILVLFVGILLLQKRKDVN